MNDLRKYTIEFFVILFSILTAFALDRWNDNRIRDREFNVLLEQYYNAMYIDLQSYHNSLNMVNDHLDLTDRLIRNPDTLVSDTLVLMIMYLEFKPGLYNEAVKTLGEFMEVSHYNDTQNRLIWEILSYVSANELTWANYQELFSDLLPDVPRPGATGAYYGTETMSYLYSEEDIQDVTAALSTRKFRSRLLSIQGDYLILKNQLLRLVTDGVVVLNKIRSYHPGLKFLIDDLSIAWSPSLAKMESVEDISMTQITDTRWADTVYLEAGYVSFRNRKSFNHFWGNDEEPKPLKGTLIYYGGSIQLIEEGDYYVVIDIMDNTYSIEKLD